MDIESVRAYCFQKKGVTENFPFDDTTLVIRVMDKMFAVLSLQTCSHVILKCDPEYAVELRERHAGIEGAFHFNKKHWNQVSLAGDIDNKLILRLIDHSYEEVIKKFTKKLRARYDALP